MGEVVGVDFGPCTSIVLWPLTGRAVVSTKHYIQNRQRDSEISVDETWVGSVMPMMVFWRRYDPL